MKGVTGTLDWPEEALRAAVPRPPRPAPTTRDGGRRGGGGEAGPGPSPTRATVPPQLPAELVDRIRARLAAAGQAPTGGNVAEALRVEGWFLGEESVLAVVTALRCEFTGAGPLEPLLADPHVTDVLVNGPDDVWIDRGDGLERTGVSFTGEPAVRRLAQRLAASAGRRLDDASPYVDARLPDGARLHAVLPPLSPRATCLSLRIGRRRPFSMEELAAAGTFVRDIAAFLDDMVAARLSFLVSGGTGSGKTTILSSILGRVPVGERIILVEDTGELAPAHPHVVRLQTRPANQEGIGRVTLADLVRQALRMRPDRLVVGEVRGGEVVDLLTALNTGHDGGCGTVHANSAGDVPARLEALAMAAGLGRAALHSQLDAAVQAVVHLVRGRDQRRRVSEVRVLERDGAGLVRAVPALTVTGQGVERGTGWPRLQAHLERGRPR